MYTTKTNPYTLQVNDPTDAIAVFALAPTTPPSLYSHVRRYGVTSSDACASIQKVAIYSNCSVLAVGCTIYLDQGGTQTSPAGYYSDGTTVFRVDSAGVIASAGSCVVADPVVSYNCINNVCVEVAGSGGTYPFLKGCLDTCGCSCTSAGVFVGGDSLSAACNETNALELFISSCDGLYYRPIANGEWGTCSTAFTGYIKQGVVINYYSNGRMVSSESCAQPSSTPTATPRPSSTPTATPVPSTTPTATPPPSPSPRLPDDAGPDDVVVSPSPTPSQSRIPPPTPSASPIVWRDCISGDLKTGTAPAGFRQVNYTGAGGGTCWEPITEIGFNPELSSVFTFRYQRGSAELPQPKSAMAINPSYGKSYKVGINTNEMIIVEPSAFTLSPRSQVEFLVNVTPELLASLGDGDTTLYMDIDIEEI